MACIIKGNDKLKQESSSGIPFPLPKLVYSSCSIKIDDDGSGNTNTYQQLTCEFDWSEINSIDLFVSDNPLTLPYEVIIVSKWDKPPANKEDGDVYSEIVMGEDPFMFEYYTVQYIKDLRDIITTTRTLYIRVFTTDFYGILNDNSAGIYAFDIEPSIYEDFYYNKMLLRNRKLARNIFLGANYWVCHYVCLL